MIEGRIRRVPIADIGLLINHVSYGSAAEYEAFVKFIAAQYMQRGCKLSGMQKMPNNDPKSTGEFVWNGCLLMVLLIIIVSILAIMAVSLFRGGVPG